MAVELARKASGEGQKRAPRRLEAPKPRRRIWLLAGTCVFFLSLLSVVAAHAYIAQEQMKLSNLNERITKAQMTQQRLREQLDRLEDPGRLAQIAQNRLGLVPPTTVQFVTPSTPLSASPNSLAASVTGASSITPQGSGP